MLRAEVPAVKAGLEDVRTDLADAIRHVAVVRYDAFGDMGGRLSFSAAMLDDSGDGLVFSSINGRSETRTYAKGVKHGTSEAQLSPEEEQVVTWAMRGHAASPTRTGAASRSRRRRGRAQGQRAASREQADLGAAQDAGRRPRSTTRERPLRLPRSGRDVHRGRAAGLPRGGRPTATPSWSLRDGRGGARRRTRRRGRRRDGPARELGRGLGVGDARRAGVRRPAGHPPRDAPARRVRPARPPRHHARRRAYRGQPPARPAAVPALAAPTTCPSRVRSPPRPTPTPPGWSSEGRFDAALAAGVRGRGLRPRRPRRGRPRRRRRRDPVRARRRGRSRPSGRPAPTRPRSCW